jgi:hypothetical protein
MATPGKKRAEGTESRMRVPSPAELTFMMEDELMDWGYSTVAVSTSGHDLVEPIRALKAANDLLRHLISREKKIDEADREV